jgi:hypothetical protein
LELLSDFVELLLAPFCICRKGASSEPSSSGSGSVGDIIEAISCRRPRFHRNGYFLSRNCDFSTMAKADFLTDFLGVLLGD